MTLQPDEGFDLFFEVKTPGTEFDLMTQRLNFSYAEAFSPLPDAYVTLLRDVAMGDQTLFIRADEQEIAWKLVDPLLVGDIPIHPYPAGTWGPVKAPRIFNMPPAQVKATKVKS